MKNVQDVKALSNVVDLNEEMLNDVCTSQIEGQTNIYEYLKMLTPEGKIIPEDFMNLPVEVNDE